MIIVMTTNKFNPLYIIVNFETLIRTADVLDVGDLGGFKGIWH